MTKAFWLDAVHFIIFILITIISITTFIVIFVGTDIVRRKLMLVTLGIN